MHPDGAGTVADLKPGDVLAAATSTGHPRVITHITGYSTRAITTTELGGHRETVTSKRRTTGIGIVARRRDNLTPIETAIADAPLGVVITTCDELSEGAAVTVEGMVTDGFGNVTDYDVVSVTGTISSIDGDGHHRGRPTRRLTLDIGPRPGPGADVQHRPRRRDAGRCRRRRSIGGNCAGVRAQPSHRTPPLPRRPASGRRSRTCRPAGGQRTGPAEAKRHGDSP